MIMHQDRNRARTYPERGFQVGDHQIADPHALQGTIPGAEGLTGTQHPAERVDMVRLVVEGRGMPRLGPNLLDMLHLEGAQES